MSSANRSPFTAAWAELPAIFGSRKKASDQISNVKDASLKRVLPFEMPSTPLLGPGFRQLSKKTSFVTLDYILKPNRVTKRS